MAERFKILFSGELQGHVEAEKVIAHLVATFKLPETQARVLVLDGNRHVIKKNLDAEAAQRYRSALEDAGMIVHVEPMEPPASRLDLAPLQEEAAAPSQPRRAESAPAAAAAAAAEPDRCPACGSTRVDDGVCRDCGTVREEYLARQGAGADRGTPEGEGPTAGADPYTAPRADLIARAQVGELCAPRGVPAGHGWSWIVRGFWHFKTNPLAWVLAIVVLIGIAILLNLIPFVGSFIYSLLGAVFSAGLMLGAKTQDQGGDFRVDHLFAGFKENFGQLVLVGLLYVVGAVLITILIFGLIIGSMIPLMGEMDSATLGARDALPALAALGPMGLIGILVGALLYIPLLMSLMFAPALVMLDAVGATDAMKLSFSGCLKNMLPFLIYGLAAVGLLILGAIPLGLGLLVVWPTLTAAIYVAYRDIYFEEEG